MAVNVSARSLARIDFARDVLGVLERYGVDGKQLIVEVTETSLLTDPACASIVLGEFARAGVRVSIDDFGSGQTSLGYLSSLHVSELKIDRSFVTDVLENQSDAAIVQSIVDLAHNLSLRVVGEGVETASVLDHLREAGCDEAQGFFVAMPMPIEDLHKWLGHHTSEDFVRRSPRGEAAHRK
jgi:EAL domain-containing protein (putative c-di-GMP-specific phosphodiesterase class I)